MGKSVQLANIARSPKRHTPFVSIAFVAIATLALWSPALASAAKPLGYAWSSGGHELRSRKDVAPGACNQWPARRRSLRRKCRSRPKGFAAIVGGNVLTSTAEAPWSVLVVAAVGSSSFICTGSIIDATHVVTAAHCTFPEGSSVQFAPSAYRVRAGIVDATPSGDRTKEQQSEVSAVRIYPGYIPGKLGDDVAELILEQPLEFSDAVRPIAFVAASSHTLGGATLYGWGLSGSPEILDYRERSLDGSLLPSYYCSHGYPSIICSRSPVGESCGGDSGGGFVLQSNPTVLAALDEFGARPCSSANLDGLVDLSSPGISSWLSGDEAPTLAPRAEQPASLGGDANVGGTATCSSPPWSTQTSLSFLFLDANSLEVLQVGPTTYPLTQRDIGRKLECAALASNSGGVTTAVSGTLATIAPSVIPILVLNVDRSGGVTATHNASIPLVLHLSVAGRNGHVALDRTLGGGSDGAVNLSALPVGQYVLCLTSDPAWIYARASNCLSWARSGSSPRLFHVRQRRFRRSHWIVRAAVEDGLIRTRVQVIWTLARCNRCKAKVVAHKATLYARTLLASPRVPTGWQASLVVKFPSVTVTGVPYESGIYSSRLPRRLSRTGSRG